MAALALTAAAPTLAQKAIHVAAGGKVGIGTEDPGTNLHVQKAGGAFSYFSNTVLAVQNSASPSDGAILTILNGSSGNGQLLFGDTDSEFQGRVVYVHSTDDLLLFANNAIQMTINPDGADLLTMSNGATLTAGGEWTNASSRALKQDIVSLSSVEARQALLGLDPVRFTYKREPGEEHIGFVAEDVPELLAHGRRTTLSTMDIVGVVTKVVQEQQAVISSQAETIADLSARLAAIEARLKD